MGAWLAIASAALDVSAHETLKLFSQIPTWLGVVVRVRSWPKFVTALAIWTIFQLPVGVTIFACNRAFRKADVV